MTIIKSFTPFIIFLSASTSLHAQEIKAEVAKPVERKIPAAQAPVPSPMPVVKPMDGIVNQEISPDAAKTPLPAAKDETKKPGADAKTVALTLDPAAATKKLTGEQVKVLNGNKETPAPAAARPNTIDANARPVPVTRSTLVNQE